MFNPSLLEKRIFILDGAMGTQIQKSHPDESVFRGSRFSSHPVAIKGNNDVLNLTAPHLIRSIHEAYLTAGADIIETNTFNATRISQAEYHLENEVVEINRAGAALARAAADTFSLLTPEKPRFVAGSVGPTSKSCAMSPDINNPGARAIDFDALSTAYEEQMVALIDGGVDFIALETCFDPINAKAAIFALEKINDQRREKVPLLVSATVSDASGRLLTGQTLEAFILSISHASTLFSVGLNCALGAEEMYAHVLDLAQHTPYYIHAYPNAGLPNALGAYDQTPQEMCRIVTSFAEQGLVNIVGGCCGTTPEHIRLIAEALATLPPHVRNTPRTGSFFCGLEVLHIVPGESLFCNVGERTNVAGSRKFLDLIKQRDFNAALDIARKQVEDGAQIIDVNMDDALLDSKECMVEFLNRLSSDPAIARVPVMIDSSRFETIEAGLKCLQGKGIVNSLSLKNGEQNFQNALKTIRRLGAAVILMAFDEEGQADTYQRRCAIAERLYTLAVKTDHFPEENIIFDLNVFAIATGIETHDRCALDFIEAVRFVTNHFPHCLTSGGISNVSFSFRSHALLRKMIHSVFLYHAIHAGLRMGIVNPAQLFNFEDIAPDAKLIIENAVLNRTSNASDALSELAQQLDNKNDAKNGESDKAQWRNNSVDDRLVYAICNGISTYLNDDVPEALERLSSPQAVIQGPLMQAMSEVGVRFGSGKMFLPQVLKSAKVMKDSFDILLPYLQNDDVAPVQKGKIVIATVKGDVHDIGKNIVAAVLRCNAFDVIDLGVMTPLEKIIETARNEHAKIIALSGLITPSLEEMIQVCKAVKKNLPGVMILVGGATTSPLHTVLNMRPVYENVFHVREVIDTVHACTALYADEQTQNDFILSKKDEYDTLLHAVNTKKTEEILPYAEAQKRAPKLTHWVDTPSDFALHTLTIPLEKLRPHIDWKLIADTFEIQQNSQEFLELKAHCNALLDAGGIVPKGVFRIYPCERSGDDILLFDEDRKNIIATLFTLRQQRENSKFLALADFVEQEDYVGLLCATAGLEVNELLHNHKVKCDVYTASLLESLANALAEAATAFTENEMRKVWKTSEKMIRPAPGYPSQPDHSEKVTILNLLNAAKTVGVELTSSFMMTPLWSVCACVIANDKAEYFAVGTIADDQQNHYKERKNAVIKKTI